MKLFNLKWKYRNKKAVNNIKIILNTVFFSKFN